MPLEPSVTTHSEAGEGSRLPMEKISVAVRFRPPTAVDLFSDRIWKVEDNRISLHWPLGTPISGVSFAFGESLSAPPRLPPSSPISPDFLYDYYSFPPIRLCLWSELQQHDGLWSPHQIHHPSRHQWVQRWVQLSSFFRQYWRFITLACRNCFRLWADEQRKNFHHEWLGRGSRNYPSCRQGCI